MRLSKFIFTGIVITAIALGYVHQRAEIVKAGYDLQKSRKHLSCLIDQNSRLMYNLSRLESPKHLLASLDGGEVEFATHRNRRVSYYQLVRVDSDDSIAAESFIGKLFDLFTLSAEARSRE